MSKPYDYPPEYRQEPLLPIERQDAYDAFLEVAGIGEVCDQRPNGMYTSLQPRFDKAYFFGEMSERSGLGKRAVLQATKELKILRLVDYSDVHVAVIHPQAVLFSGEYQEIHAKEAFRFSNTGSRQYYWEGDQGAVREVQDRQRAYDELAAGGHLNHSPTIPRTVGQYVSQYLR